VRERRTDGRRVAARIAGPGGLVALLGLRLWAKAARRPVDSLAILGAIGASLVIIVNAIFLQSGAHPAPFFNNPASPQAADGHPKVAFGAPPKPAEASPAHSAVGARTPQTVSARHDDPIAELIGAAIGTPSRVMAVQRVLSEFGYGQIKASGILDQPTSAAIEKFESEHKLPVTGRLSVRLLNELSAMTSRTID
jgi:Putative peptidoglycan binding domain